MGCDPTTKCRIEKFYNNIIDNSTPFKLDFLAISVFCQSFSITCNIEDVLMYHLEDGGLGQLFLKTG
jgi:hypothetical protein